jgi:hypothetical protein
MPVIEPHEVVDFVYLCYRDEEEINPSDQIPSQKEEEDMLNERAEEEEELVRKER